MTSNLPFFLALHHFVDNPLKPVQESKETLAEMIAFGELLLPVRDAAIDVEEVTFILAIQYLKAADSGAMPKKKSRARFEELVKKFKSQWPDSLKLLTLEALASP